MSRVEGRRVGPKPYRMFEKCGNICEKNSSKITILALKEFCLMSGKLFQNTISIEVCLRFRAYMPVCSRTHGQPATKYFGKDEKEVLLLHTTRHTLCFSNNQ